MRPYPRGGSISCRPGGEPLDKLLDIARRIVAGGGWLAALVFLPGLILVAIFDIATRRFLQLGSTPLQELQWHFFFACAMFAVGATYLRDRHVRVDILRERLPAPWKERIERVLLVVLLLPVCLVLAWFGTRMAWLSWTQDETSAAAMGLSQRWIVKTALPIGALLLFLAGCHRLVRGPTGRQEPGPEPGQSRGRR